LCSWFSGGYILYTCLSKPAILDKPYPTSALFISLSSLADSNTLIPLSIQQYDKIRKPSTTIKSFHHYEGERDNLSDLMNNEREQRSWLLICYDKIAKQTATLWKIAKRLSTSNKESNENLSVKYENYEDTYH
jgi:hypothetical protein